ncbi:MAG: hypothetical protein BMS9Abin17_0919 [Acidimicrobiia bacterium]|nr:MAG: hypothetical protein BMS9Abin17_0919 [Acidimicrobiia bacterium]
MIDRVEICDVSDSPRISISTNAGDIIIRPWEEMRVKVVLSGHAETVESTVVDTTSDSVSVRTDPGHRAFRFFARGMDVVVFAPPGGTLRINSSSGDIRVRLPLEDVEINSGSGDVRLDEPVGDARIKVASGQVKIGHVERDAEVTSANGDIRIGRARDVATNTVSGNTNLGLVESSARIHSASGEVRVRDFRGTDLTIKTMSGSSVIGLAPGRTVAAQIKTMSGQLRNKIRPVGGDRTGRMNVKVTSFSGDVILRNAR